MDCIGHTRFDDKLKTKKSRRKIPFSLNDRIKKLLLEHMKEQQEIFEKARAIKDRHWKWNKEQYIFLSRNYYPYVAESLSKALRDFRTKYNLECVTPYGLRHSFATFWSEKGMDDVALQELMGHEDYETTRKFYIKTNDKHIEKEIQKAKRVG